MSIGRAIAQSLSMLATAALLAACSPAAPAASTTQGPATAAPTTAAIPTTATATKSPTVPAIAVAAKIRGDWLAAAPASTGLGAHGLLQVSFDWKAGIDFWIMVGEHQAVMSHSGPSPMDQIHLVSTDATTGCKLGDEGHYSWKRSADGLFLEITRIDDACQYRGELLARTWVHALDAVNDGGPGVLRAGSVMLLATVPAYRWALTGPTGVADLYTIQNDAPDLHLRIIDGAMGLDAPCSPTRKPIKLAATTSGFVDYLEGLPSVTVAWGPTTIDGLPAAHLTLDSDASTDCPNGPIAVFRGSDGAAEPEYGFAPGGIHTTWVIELSDRAILLWYEGADAAADKALVDSIHFIDTLPTP